MLLLAVNDTNEHEFKIDSVNFIGVLFVLLVVE
jgi:hypothetical protein